MKHTTQNAGIGFMAAIIIIALIGIGGVAVVQVYNQQQVAVSTETAEESTAAEAQVVSEAKSDARDALVQARVALRTDLTRAVAILTDARDALTAAYATVDASLHAELDAVAEVLAEAQADVEADIAAGTSEAAAALDEVVADIEQELVAEGVIEVGETTTEESTEDTGSEMSEETESSTASDEAESSTEVGADATTDTEVETDVIDAGVETETSVQGEASL